MCRSPTLSPPLRRARRIRRSSYPFRSACSHQHDGTTAPGRPQFSYHTSYLDCKTNRLSTHSVLTTAAGRGVACAVHAATGLPAHRRIAGQRKRKEKEWMKKKDECLKSKAVICWCKPDGAARYLTKCLPF